MRSSRASRLGLRRGRRRGDLRRGRFHPLSNDANMRHFLSKETKGNRVLVAPGGSPVAVLRGLATGEPPVATRSCQQLRLRTPKTSSLLVEARLPRTWLCLAPPAVASASMYIPPPTPGPALPPPPGFPPTARFSKMLTWSRQVVPLAA